MAEHTLHNSTGWIPRSARPQAMAGAVARLAADPKLRARLGEAGTAMVRRHLTHDGWLARYAALLAGAR